MLAPSSATAWRPTQAPAARPALQQRQVQRAAMCKASAAEPTQQQQQKQQQQPLVARRAALASALAAAAAPWLLSGPAFADNDAVKQGLNKYVKKKKLERLDTYVPPLLEARDQLVRVGRVMLQDPAEARQMLRSGVFKGLRDNVRSLGEYTSQAAGNDEGRQLVRTFFAQLEGFDGCLRTAVRGDEGLPEDARTFLDGTIAALDRLLSTVPEADMQQALDVVAAISRLDDEAASEEAAAKAAAARARLEGLL